MVLPSELPLVRCSVGGAKVREGGQPVVRSRCQEKCANCEMFCNLQCRRGVVIC